ncbi:MAG: PVC-type heme-binding CxxCH protein [Planctomycetota bacterium]|jgi:putative membrane-bound dehydrogenase-like protein
MPPLTGWLKSSWVCRTLHGLAAAVVCTAACLPGGGAAQEQDPSFFDVPPGFRVTQWASDELATNIYAMTTDSRGRIVVSGPGYIKTLIDSDRDGLADRAELFTDQIRHGSQGLCFVGYDLICVGESQIHRFRDTDADGRADGPSKVWTRFNAKAGGEHRPHAIVHGPDGWLYHIGGNDSGYTSDQASHPDSPLPLADKGALIRFDTAGRNFQTLAEGFRNPYDIAFNARGHVFTYDADGERDHHLPWYAGSRVFDIAVGRHHGWVLPGFRRAWNRPHYYHDSAPRVADIGRGSPTGVVNYRHHAYPEKYRDGLFVVCWSRGIVYFIPVQPDGASYSGRIENFMQTRGAIGFAPTDIVVGPEGDLYVCIGGRGTRGGVFRVTYTGDKTKPRSSDPLLAVLDAPQPLDAWSRADWQPRADQLGPAPFHRAALDKTLTVNQRLRAIEILVDRFDGLTPEQARAITEAAGTPAPVAARAVWALGRAQQVDNTHDLVDYTSDTRPLVQRAAYEALLGRKAPGATPVAAPNHDDPLVDFLASTWRRRPGYDGRPVTPDDLAAALDAIEASSDPSEYRLIETARLILMSLGDVRIEASEREINTGYTVNDPNRLPEPLRDRAIDFLDTRFPSAHPNANLELARTLGALHADRPGLLEKILQRVTSTSHPTDDAHYLFTLAQLPGERSAGLTQQTANAFAALDDKIHGLRITPGGNWPTRLGEAFEALAERDPGLRRALVDAPTFGRVEHAFYIDLLDDPNLQRRAARAMLRHAANSAQPWTDSLVRVLEHLPPAETIEPLRGRWNNPLLRDAIALRLAEIAHPLDFNRLNEALESIDDRVARTAANALIKIERQPQPTHIATAVRALTRHGVDTQTAAPIARLLGHWTGQDHPADDPHAWRAWFTEAHTAHAKLLGDPLAPHEDWRSRVGAIDFTKGDTRRGQIVFQQRACATCHAGSKRLGPDLKGVAQRFDPTDLYLHVYEPNAAISDLYKAIEVTTKTGETYIGVTVYQSPAVTIIEAGLGELIRFTNDQVRYQRPASRSPMPPGLMTGATDRDLADLYAYLQTLR